MDMHAGCTVELCLSPLHPGPCKGTKRPGGGGGKGKKAPKPRAPKKAAAPRAGRAPAAGKPDASPKGRGAAAADVASLSTSVDSKKFGESIAIDLATAKSEAERNAVITHAALSLGRVMANERAPHASPLARKRLASMLALHANDAIRSGNSDTLRQIVARAGTDLDDSEIDSLVRTNGRSISGAGAPAEKDRLRWSGMLAPIGKPTGDGRMFAAGALTNRDLPLPLRFQRSDGGGHGGAVVVARILEITYDDGQAFGRGDWLDPAFTPEVSEAQELTRQGVIGPSVDLDDAVMELVPADGDTVEAAADDCGCDDAAPDKPKPMIKLVTQGRISGATLVQIPAFAECSALQMSASAADVADLDLASLSPGDPIGVRGEDDDGTIDAGFFVDISEDGQMATVVRDNGDVEAIAASRLSAASADDVDAWDSDEAWGESLTAGLTAENWQVAAAIDGPPAAWFADPRLAGPTPLTITPDGRVYGHLAEWGVCHVGLPGCVTPPESRSNYAFFHVGEVITAEGDSIEVGKITLGTGHADADAGFRAAADHYDNTGATAAVVRAGQDSFGIWVAGATTPGCDGERLAELRRSPLSGDWRRIGGGLELVAALAVNVPGFPVPRSRVAAGRPMSLVASGVVTEASATSQVDVEATFQRLMRRRDDYATVDDLFAAAEREQAETRVGTAAALLAFLDE